MRKGRGRVTEGKEVRQGSRDGGWRDRVVERPCSRDRVNKR